jgi:hypothetical protein
MIFSIAMDADNSLYVKFIATEAPTFYVYRNSANSFRGNYSFLEVEERKLFKGGNYSKEETIN